jgi:hypothetical protein
VTDTTVSSPGAAPIGPTAVAPAEPFRFFDNREKYLLFVTTTSEKAVTAERIGRELAKVRPEPPALRIFDAGTGNGEVLSRVLREAHHRMPTVPLVAVGKEISIEDARMCLDRMADRLAEHPQTVFVLTNLFYPEAPHLQPAKPERVAELNWNEVALDGTTGHELSHEIAQLGELLEDGWKTRPSPTTGNPLYVRPSVLVLYRRDQAFAMHDIIPRRGEPVPGYDLMIAAQPYRSRASVEFKVDRILGPLSRALRAEGRMIVIQPTGHDPGMEVIRTVWPDEQPFTTPRGVLVRRLEEFLNGESHEFRIEGHHDDQALFTYRLHALPDEVDGNRIGTSTLLAAWNAAVYVAQIDDERLDESLRTGNYLEGTTQVLQRHAGLWFQDESFVVVRSER